MVLFSCILINWLFNHYIYKEQKKLVAIDRLSGKIHAHDEWMKTTILDPTKYDSIALYSDDFIQSSEAHYNELNQQVNQTFESQYSNKKHMQDILQELKVQEFNLFLNASKIGFKDAGFMGEMRKVIHAIESNYPQYTSEILSLRRHEKDFIMRLDRHYAEKLRQEVLTFNGNRSCFNQLVLYLQHFDSMQVNLLKIKEPNTQNAQNKWNKTNENLLNYMRAYRAMSIEQSVSITFQSGIIQLVVASTSLVLLLLISILIANRITKQVNQLQSGVHDFISSGYSTIDFANKTLPKNEIGLITSHFLRLVKKINSDVHVLEDRVARRTQVLNDQNKLLANNQKETEESMRYAGELQHSLLMPIDKMAEEFKELHIHYSPKSLVGGDFYWMKTYRETGHEKVVFALADCTGHGVPGALLSVMGMNLLDEMFNQGFRNPHTLLKQLRISLLKRFGNTIEKRMDGMDMAIFSLNKKTNELLFSGAQLSLWILRNNEIIELKGDRVPVGFTYSNHEEYDLHHIQLLAGDRILLFTDGLVDQFGVITQKKFGKKNLRKLISQEQNESTSKLFERILAGYYQWKGTMDQTDDCSIVFLEVQATTEPQSALKNGKSMTARNETKKVVYQ